MPKRDFSVDVLKVLAALLIIISNAANKPQSDELSDTFRMEALSVLRSRQRA